MCRSAQRRGKPFKHAKQFKKGFIPWNKGLTGVMPSGCEHHKWTEEPGYHALHAWVKRYKGSPEKCSNCGEMGRYNGAKWTIHWANIDGKYRRDISDYIALCVLCHARYDIEHNGKYQR
jgi:hypothetical protein